MADPDRLGTVMVQLAGVTLVCWLMGSATEAASDLHGPRLETLLERLVDTPVRGIVYEAAGTVEPALLAQGAAAVRAAAERWRDAGRGGRGGSGRPRVLGRRDEGGGRAAALEQGARQRQRERCQDEHDRDDRAGRSSQPRGPARSANAVPEPLGGWPAAGSGRPARSRPARALPAARRPATARARPGRARPRQPGSPWPGPDGARARRSAGSCAGARRGAPRRGCPARRRGDRRSGARRARTSRCRAATPACAAAPCAHARGTRPARLRRCRAARRPGGGACRSRRRAPARSDRAHRGPVARR